MLDERTLENIEARLQDAADEAFDPDEAIDSDGTDQAERDAFLRARDIVREEFDKAVTHA